MTLEEEKRYLLLLSAYYCGARQQDSTPAQVLDCIEKKNWAIFSANELTCTQEEAAWKSEASALRQGLVEKKLFQAGQDWKITPAGQEELARLHQEVAASFPVKVSYAAIEYAESVFPFA